MEYIELKDALHIVDIVTADKGIRRKCKAIRKRLKELPTVDVVEVVRCQKCTEWDEIEGECSHWYGMRENCYCCHGIKKEGVAE